MRAAKIASRLVSSLYFVSVVEQQNEYSNIPILIYSTGNDFSLSYTHLSKYDKIILYKTNGPYMGNTEGQCSHVSIPLYSVGNCFFCLHPHGEEIATHQSTI